MMLGERGLGLVVHFPSRCVAKIKYPVTVVKEIQTLRLSQFEFFQRRAKILKARKCYLNKEFLNRSGCMDRNKLTYKTQKSSMCGRLKIQNEFDEILPLETCPP